MSSFEILAITPSPYVVQDFCANKKGLSNASIAKAAAQAGYLGIVDLAFKKLSSVTDPLLIYALEHNQGVRLSIGQLSDFAVRAKTLLKQIEDKNRELTLIVVPDELGRVTQLKSESTAKLINSTRSLLGFTSNGRNEKEKPALRILVEIVSVSEAKIAQGLAVDGVIAKGQEASGVVGETTAFVLMQECLSQISLPVYVWGGVGLHTASACYAAGASGVILDSQLLLARESQIPLVLKAKIEQFDGTELHVLPLGPDGGSEARTGLRVYTRAGHNLLAAGNQLNNLIEFSDVNELRTLETIYDRMVKHNANSEPTDWLIPLGQDVAFAKTFAQKYLSVAGILHAVRNSIDEHITLSRKFKPLAPQAPLARSHGTTYPIVQGAMTRVSDKAEFAYEVAKAGGLPFLALALMRGTEAETLLAQTQVLLKDMSWGVGILGFVPNELRVEQMAAIEKYKPPYVLIAGGRPDQAKHLEDQGIKTYLHVPSPLLLDSFIEMGSRRFIFEGKECGGHIGPRSSFVLWEAMIEHLLDNIGSRENASSYHVLFAGGIHDARSAATVSVLAAPLAARGVRVGILMGTAYLFTEEAVSSGAIVKKFQEAAIGCEQTALLETGPGHAIRCIDSPYKRAFDRKRHTLADAGRTKDEIREELELMNLGRLRLASKGLIRKDTLSESGNDSSVSSREKVIAELTAAGGQSPSLTKNSGVNNLDQASEDTQWQHGMYMIGQVASLHTETLTMRQLHENVCQGSIALIESLADDLAEEHPAQDKSLVFRKNQDVENTREPIAIIGMSCLLPKSKDVEAFWSNILNKVDAIEEVPLSQWDWRNYYDPDPQARDKIYSKWGGFLEKIEFDPTKYGIPPSSLNSIDPMQILLLEVTDAALTDAGYNKKPFPRDKTSVILANAGHGPITAFYSLRSMLGWKLAHLDPALKLELEEILPEWTEDSFPGYLGNVTAGRVANRFDLGGVNFSIDAACASSLAALYTAVAELRNKNSDLVFLASTDTHNQPGDYLSFSKTHAFSADGHCKTFDSSADGIVISEGMAMLVLKRLGDAERDGDRIYAVIKGIAGSSDGRDLSLTAPRPAGQIKSLLRAYEDAGVDPSTVTLIEAHGTGTVAGDKAEVEALKQVFERCGAQERSCAIGSVKTMIGHTKATAGLASLIKVAKSLHHKTLPPTIGVKTPNPACHFEKGPFYINSESRPWIIPTIKPDGNQSRVRRAGVSAFGFGGTNFHAVLEEYKPADPELTRTEEDPAMPAELFIFTGTSRIEIIRSITACAEKAKKLAENAVNTNLTLAALAYWQFLRDSEHHGQFHKLTTPGRPTETEHTEKYCLAIVASSLDDLNEKLARAKDDMQSEDKREIKDPRGIYFRAKSWSEADKSAKLAFLFPGQGSQYPGMLARLAMRFAEVRQIFAQADEVLEGQLNKSLSQYIFPPPSFTKEEELGDRDALTDTRIAQAAMGTADIAAHSLLASFAVEPNMVAGHSYGEYVALCAAGYFDFRSLINISKQRGEILAQSNNGRLPHGAMAAVSCSAMELKLQMKSLPASISIANLNSPGQTVIAGGLDEVEQAISILQNAGMVARRIPVSQAFHTKLMKEASKQLETVLKGIEFAQGSIDVYSNLQGQKYDRSPVDVTSKLSSHTIEPVDFVSQIKNMYADGARIFLEVGPGSVLTSLSQSILADTEATCIALDRSGRDGLVSLLHALAQLAAGSVHIDFQRLYQYRLFALKPLLGSEQPTIGKKLTYLVDSANVELKGQTAINHGAKLEKVAPGRSKSFVPSNKALNNETPSGNLAGAAFGNSPLDNTMRNIATGRANIVRDDVKAVSNQHNNQIDGIMLQFQQSMQQMANSFLETQQRVMLAYLAREKAEGYSTSEVFSSTTQEADLVQPGNNSYANNSYQSSSYQQSESTAVPTLSQPVTNTKNASLAIQTETAAGPQIEMDTEQLVGTLMEIVAERTGYPVDMIDPNLDLEADLGIDSIKRVEILNKFRRVLPEVKQKQLESGIEELAGAKTLQSIIDWLRASHDYVLPQQGDGNNGAHSSSPKELTLAPHGQGDLAAGGNGKHDNARALAVVDSLQGAINGSSSIIRRGVVSPLPLPELLLTGQQLDERLSLIKENNPIVLITADRFNFATAVAELLKDRGLMPIILKQSDNNIVSGNGSGLFKAPKAGSITEKAINLQDFADIQTYLSCLQQNNGIGMLLHLQSFAEDNADLNRASAVSLLHILKYLSLSLSESKVKPRLLAVTTMGGKFGNELATTAWFSPVQAAIVGLTKVAAKEMEDCACKTIDFDLSMQRANEDLSPGLLRNMASLLLKESIADDAIVEVGYRSEQRWGLEIADGSLKADFSHPPLNENSVVLITGGARGITAEIAVQLAQRYKPVLILIGRSPLPSTGEDPGFAGLKGIRELKAKIIEVLKAEGKPVNIPEVEARYQTFIKEREIRNNIERLSSSAAKAEYYSLDVRDSEALTRLIEKVYNDHGKIDAVIHGAGVIEDALLKDKDKESFLRVFDTKVNSALTLLKSLKLDSLHYLFLFSSVVGRTGNAGQADYVAANEVLNKLASTIKEEMPQGRAAAIMWGPWKGGMAQPELESIFAQYGWAMIDVQKGCDSFIDEMFCSNKKESEVLLVAEPEGKSKQRGRGARLRHSEVISNDSGDKEYIVELDLQIDVFLLDHAFDGVPVLPMSYALELMCEAVHSTYPDMPLKKIENLDIPAGILFDLPKKKISIIVHEEEKQAGAVTAVVSIISGTKNRRVNFQARFAVGEEIKLDTPRTRIPVLVEMKNTNPDSSEDGRNNVSSETHIDPTKCGLGAAITLPSIADIYRQWLFHGKSFHGMKTIYAAGEKGVIGQVSGLSPEHCLRLEKDGNWIIDPVMFDCSMQLGGIWARRCLDITALPTGFRCLQFFAPMKHSPDERFLVHIIICPDSSNNELRCDMAIYSESGQLLMFVEELSGVGSKSLHRLASQNLALEGGAIEAGVSG